MWHKRHSRWQSGQALAEYTVLIPIGIAAIIAGVAIGSAVKSGLEDTVEAFNNPPASAPPTDDTEGDPLDPDPGAIAPGDEDEPPGSETEGDPPTGDSGDPPGDMVDDDPPGGGSETIPPGDDGENPEDVGCVPPAATLPDLVNATATGLSGHTIKLVAYQYLDGKTELVYQVTPKGKFNWWVLGISEVIGDNVISAGPNSAGWHGNNQDPIDGQKFTGSYKKNVVREFTIVLEGKYDFGLIPVGVKSSNERLTGYIQGPIARIDNVCQ